MNTKNVALWFCVGLWGGCGHDDGPLDGNEEEVITTVELIFTPESGGAPISFLFDDPDGDGGNAPTVDDIELSAGMYSVDVRFENRLESPPEDITIEVSDESADHQVFFTGSAVEGPASTSSGASLFHSYSDLDSNGLPVGLVNSMRAEAGGGELILTLRHVPPVGGTRIKTDDVSSLVRDSGFSSIGGSTDVQVSFPVAVQ